MHTQGKSVNTSFICMGKVIVISSDRTRLQDTLSSSNSHCSWLQMLSDGDMEPLQIAKKATRGVGGAKHFCFICSVKKEWEKFEHDGQRQTFCSCASLFHTTIQELYVQWLFGCLRMMKSLTSMMLFLLQTTSAKYFSFSVIRLHLKTKIYRCVDRIHRHLSVDIQPDSIWAACAVIQWC